MTFFDNLKRYARRALRAFVIAFEGEVSFARNRLAYIVDNLPIVTGGRMFVGAMSSVRVPTPEAVGTSLGEAPATLVRWIWWMVTQSLNGIHWLAVQIYQVIGNFLSWSTIQIWKGVQLGMFIYGGLFLTFTVTLGAVGQHTISAGPIAFLLWLGSAVWGIRLALALPNWLATPNGPVREVLRLVAYRKYNATLADAALETGKWFLQWAKWFVRAIIWYGPYVFHFVVALPYTVKVAGAMARSGDPEVVTLGSLLLFTEIGVFFWINSTRIRSDLLSRIRGTESPKTVQLDQAETVAETGVGEDAYGSRRYGTGRYDKARNISGSDGI